MKRIYEQSIKFHNFCLTLPGLGFVYEKREDDYLFLAGDPDYAGIEDEGFIVQGVIPFEYYDEIMNKQNRSPLSVLNEEDKL